MLAPTIMHLFRNLGRANSANTRLTLPYHPIYLAQLRNNRLRFRFVDIFDSPPTKVHVNHDSREGSMIKKDVITLLFSNSRPTFILRHREGACSRNVGQSKAHSTE